MEKVTFQNSKGLDLVGALHKPDEKTDSIVIISHGSTSNKDRKKLVDAATEYSKNGIAALRFDFGGSGDSYDSEITVSGQIEDLKAAIEYVQDAGYSNIGLQGDSLGGLVSILNYAPEIKAMVLWAPVTSKKVPTPLTDENARKELEEKGYITINKIKDNTTFRLPQQYFDERLAVDQEKILSAVKCPVLIVHGDADELVPVEHSKEAMKYLSSESQLEVISGGQHKLDKKLEQVIPLSVEWFKKFL